jgi:hypothetical protein
MLTYAPKAPTSAANARTILASCMFAPINDEPTHAKQNTAAVTDTKIFASSDSTALSFPPTLFLLFVADCDMKYSMPPNSMLKSEIRKGEAQRIQAARHAFCRIKKKIRGKKARPREPRQQSKTRLLQN